MTDPIDANQRFPVIDGIKDPIVPFPDAISLLTGQFLGSRRSRIDL
jgi:hypothetical protein